MPERRALGTTGQKPIEVIMSDGSHHHFTPQILNVLLGNHRVMKFKRASGWVTVGVNPVRVHCRRETGHSYNGHERRSTH